MKITTITVTGADDSVSPQDLHELSRMFPVVEFGILISRKQRGNPRFPSNEWLARLAETEGIRYSGHVCGSWVREILTGSWPLDEFEVIHGPGFFDRFERWQLNTHGESHKWNQGFIQSITEGPRGIIFQFDGVNNEVLSAAIQAGHPNIAALFDLSHGAGELPEQWPSLLHGIQCGYAGGLSPENVAEQCRAIQGVVGDAEIWIDAETHLRSDQDRKFNLSKVEAFITAALPFTGNGLLAGASRRQPDGRIGVRP